MRAAALRVHRSASTSSSLSGSSAGSSVGQSAGPSAGQSAGPLPGSSPGSPPWWKPDFRPATVGALALAAAAVVAAIVYSPFDGPFTGRGSLESPIGFAPAPVLQFAVNQASSQGPILPGTTEIAGSTTYRSGDEVASPSLLRSYLDAEWRKAEAEGADPADRGSGDRGSGDRGSLDPGSMDPGSMDRVLWLAAGEIASGRLRTARTRLEAAGMARSVPPGSSPRVASIEIRRLLLLSTIDFRQSRMDAAERRLRQVLEFDPGNEIARFNLGLVLEATDRRPEAVEQIGSLRNSSTPWVQSRAEAWLGSR